jgi:G3E family GTPase
MTRQPGTAGMPSDPRALAAWHLLLGIEQTARRAPVRPAASGIVPFTLVSGFLGSGKTTLLHRMLEQPAGRRIAMLINDFGAVNIDAALIRSRGPTIFELSNGCACCSLAAGLAQTLADLLTGPRAFDAIVMEASGIAEPLGILHVALSNPGVRLNAVITVADASNVRQQLEDPLARSTIEQQIRAADLVVINKVDLVEAGELARARACLRDIAPDVRTVTAIQGAVPIELLLDVPLGADTGTCVASITVSHDCPYRSHVLETPAVLDQRLLRSLAEDLPATVLRAKGFVRLAHDPSHHYLLDVVGRRWSLLRQPPMAAYPQGLVVIGTPDGEDLCRVRTALQACGSEPTARCQGSASSR